MTAPAPHPLDTGICRVRRAGDRRHPDGARPGDLRPRHRPFRHLRRERLRPPLLRHDPQRFPPILRRSEVRQPHPHRRPPSPPPLHLTGSSRTRPRRSGSADQSSGLESQHLIGSSERDLTVRDGDHRHPGVGEIRPELDLGLDVERARQVVEHHELRRRAPALEPSRAAGADHPTGADLAGR